MPETLGDCSSAGPDSSLSCAPRQLASVTALSPAAGSCLPSASFSGLFSLFSQISRSWSVWAALTKCHNVGDLNNRNVFLLVLKAGGP